MTWPSFNQTDNIDLSLGVLLPDQNIDLTKL